MCRDDREGLKPERFSTVVENYNKGPRRRSFKWNLMLNNFAPLESRVIEMNLERQRPVKI